MKALIWKLLRKHVSKSQLIGFSLANLVGLAIVILGVQFYNDIKPTFADEDSFISKDYVIITREVTSSGAIMGKSAAFEEDAIADIEAQPWCRKVGRFTSSNFSVVATVGVGSGGMRTQFFFESIPADFIDVDASEWSFNPNSPTVPVIISRDYLSLYNFGFAATQGLPKVSEGQVGSVPLEFVFSGNGLSEYASGRIVGFSNRLNTVIVPDEFLKWANQRYGMPGVAKQPLRLIIEVNRPGDPRITKYMNDHHYIVAGDKENSNKAYFFMTLIISIVIVVGILISLLSFFVLMLSIYLLLQKNTKKLQDLLLLGYSPADVSRAYIRLVVIINAAVLVLAVVLMLVARSYYMGVINGFNTMGGAVKSAATAGGSVVPAILTGIVIMACITAGNIIAIRKKINSLWIQ